MRRLAVRRLVSLMLTVLLLLQSAPVGASGKSSASATIPLAASIMAILRSVGDLRFIALLGGTESHWDAMHAAPPVFRRPAIAPIPPLARYVRNPGIPAHGIFRPGPHMLSRPLAPEESPKDPRAMRGAHGPSVGCAKNVKTRCEQSTVVSKQLLSTFTPQTFHPRTIAGIQTMSVPTVQPFLFEADTVSAPATLFVTGGAESGAISRMTYSAPAHASANQTLTFTPYSGAMSFGWISPAGVPNSTSWPAQNYTVTLNVTVPNANLTLTEITL